MWGIVLVETFVEFNKLILKSRQKRTSHSHDRKWRLEWSCGCIASYELYSTAEDGRKWGWFSKLLRDADVGQADAAPSLEATTFQYMPQQKVP